MKSYTSSILLAAIVGSVCLTLPVIAAPQSQQPTIGSHALKTSIADVVEKAMPSMVIVSGSYEIDTIEGGKPAGALSVIQTIGSGVIIDADNGYIITNFHVINNLKEIKVQLQDKRTFTAKLIGADRDSDLALIKIDGKNLRAIKIANSDNVRVGDFVVAIGNPYGFIHTATFGMVSAIGRSVADSQGYFDFIQIDAALNSGNSGGGLINMNGELVGINTAIIAPANTGNIGLGLSIPSNMAKVIADQLVNLGEVQRGLFGLDVQELTIDLAKAFGLEDTSRGVVVTRVTPNLSASRSGISVGDVILSVDGKNVTDPVQLRVLLSLIPPGKKPQVEILRNKQVKKMNIEVLDPRNESTNAGTILKSLEGVYIAEAGDDIPVNGVEIIVIDKGSVIERTGLQPHDIIVAANQKSVGSIPELEEVISNSKDVLLLQIWRDNNVFFVSLPKD